MTARDMTIELSPAEIDLFSPVGNDQEDGRPIEEMIEAFDALPDCKTWTFGLSDCYLDRYLTFEFDDDHIFDICWTYVDEGAYGDDDVHPHWFFSGMRYGTRDEIICDCDESRPGTAEPLFDPVPDVCGTYAYQVGDDVFNLTIA